MPSRMDRYYENSEFDPVASGGRTSKNSQLYKELYNNKIYTEFTDIDKEDVINLGSPINSLNNNGSRNTSNRISNFYSNNINTGETKSNNVTYRKILEEDNKDKVYNINDAIEIAKKNRTLEDEEEKKRRLKSVEYSILSDLSQEKLKEYHDKKEKGISKDEEENLEELIHTITSNSLRKKIDDELLKDLMPEDENETIISEEMLDEIKENSKIEDTNKIETTSELEKNIDKSFYTRSMDLKKEDLIFEKDETEDDLDISFMDKKEKSIGRTIAIIMLVLLVVGLLIFILHRFVQ